MNLLPLHHALRPGAAPDSPLVILMHGLGSDEQDLLGLGAELSDSATICALRAPHHYEMGGYSWFPVEWDASGIRVDQDAAKNSLETLLKTLEHLPHRLDIKPSKVIIGGFSQGAMMALGVIMRTAAQYSGALILSGASIPDFMPETPESGLSTLPVFVEHGIQDPVLPIEMGRGVKKALEALNVPLEYHEYPMQHEVSYASLRDARKWLTDVLSAETAQR
jgi:phospholipase/carboxylesterase